MRHWIINNFVDGADRLALAGPRLHSPGGLDHPTDLRNIPDRKGPVR